MISRKQRFSASGGGGQAIGHYNAMPSNNALLTMADGSQWLRGGLLLPAASYSEAASVAHLRAHQFTPANTQATAATSIATNGAGTFVVVSPQGGTYLYVSYNHGQTWAQVAHNIPSLVTPCAVLWTGTRFLAVGNDSFGNVRGATSTDAVTWTGSTVATVGGVISPHSVSVATDGTLVAVAVPGQNTSQTIFTSPTGVNGSWTARNTPSGFTDSGRIGGGFLGFLVTHAGGSSSQYLRCTDGGVTWTTSTMSSVASVGTTPIITNTAVLVLTNSSIAQRSTNFTDWHQVSLSTEVYPNLLVKGAGNVWTSSNLQGNILTSSDGLLWQSMVSGGNDVSRALPAASSRLCCLGSSSFVVANTASTDYFHYAMSTPAVANAVGGLAPSTGLIGLWRIK